MAQRPHQNTDCLDLAPAPAVHPRLRDTGQLSASDVCALPIFLYGRGLQMIAKRVPAGRAETGMLAQVQWLHANATAIADATAAALP